MIVNCFLLFNEIEYLRLGREYEYTFYDKFLIIEGTKTFAGQPKILYFEKCKDLFRKSLDKTQYEVVGDLPEVVKLSYIANNNLATSEYRWRLERYSRECMKKGLAKLGLKDDNLVVVADVDELVDMQKLQQISKNVGNSEIHRFELIDFRYSVALEPLTDKWIRPHLIKYKCLKTSDVHTLRALSVPASNTRILKFYIQAYFTLITQFFRDSISLWQKKSDGLENYSTTENSDFLNKPESAKLTSRHNPNETQIAKLLFDNNLPTNVKTRKSEIKKAIFHANSGWNFSHMAGGFKDYFTLKIQSVSHFELPSGSKLSTELNYQELLENYISRRKRGNLYDFNRPVAL